MARSQQGSSESSQSVWYDQRYSLMMFFITGFAYIPLASLMGMVSIQYDQYIIAGVVALMCTVAHVVWHIISAVSTRGNVIAYGILWVLLSAIGNFLLLFFGPLLINLFSLPQTIVVASPLDALWSALLITGISLLFSILFFVLPSWLYEGIFTAGSAVAVFTFGFPSVLDFVGLSGGWVTPASYALAGVAGINGWINGSGQIYKWTRPSGWVAFISGSSWGILGTTLGLLLHIINFIFYNRSNARAANTAGQEGRFNVNVYDRGLYVGDDEKFIVLGHVIGNLDLVRGEGFAQARRYVWSHYILGPFWLIGIFVVWLFRMWQRYGPGGR